MRKQLIGLLRREEGAVAVEFAMVAAPFLALIFGSLQILTIYFAQQVLETAAEKSSRQILTGQAQSKNVNQAQFQTLVCGNIPALLNCGNVMIDVQVASTFSAANVSMPTLIYDQYGHVTNAWQYNVGTQGQIVTVRLMYQWPVFNFILQLATQTNGTRLLMATSIFRNENYQ